MEEEAKRVPNRRRVECRFIEKASARQVTFSKRHQSLFRKAAELSLLCGAEIAIITYSPHGNLFAFAHPSNPDALIDRYLSGGATGPAAAEADAHREPEREAETMAVEPEKRDISSRATRPAAAKVDVQRQRYEDAVAKLEEAKREAETMAAEPGKRDRWWEEEVGDDMGEEELEHYVASLEGLMKLVADRVGECGDADLGFFGRLLANLDMDKSADLDAALLAELLASP